MLRKKILQIAVSGCIAASVPLSGCTSFSSEPTRFYSLTSSVPQKVTINQSRSLSIGVGPLDFPELLDRPQIISRTSSYAIKRSEQHYWGGSVESEFTQVLADHLQAQLQTNQVLVYPWDNRHRPDFQLRGAITRFDGILGGKIYLQARWQLMGRGKEGVELIRNSHIETNATDASYSAYVSALSQAIAALGEEITQCVENPKDCR